MTFWQYARLCFRLVYFSSFRSRQRAARTLRLRRSTLFHTARSMIYRLALPAPIRKWQVCAAAKKFKFSSQNFVDENLIDSVDGHAEREATKTAVALEKPQPKLLSLAPGVVFPTEHMVRVINAARAGQSVLSFPVYDGSETGDKVFDTLTVIGHEIAPGERNHDDAAAGEPKLASMPRWPVTISYFERGKSDNNSEQTPAYAIRFELYANGISRALALDYNNFVINGKLASLDIKDAKP